MYQLNNLDIILLAVVLISGLIALSRGLIKEVLSIIGWVLVTILIVYLLPILLPFAQNFIKSGLMAGIATALIIFTLFSIVWIYLSSHITTKIRTSKLSGLDRLLGLFFGIMRAFLLIILFNILVNWMIPVEKQSEILTESKYFRLAGNFAKPVEELIPQDTLDMIKTTTESLSPEQQNKQKEQDSFALFEKLAQPQIKKSSKEEEKSAGYKESERESLDRLIDSVD